MSEISRNNNTRNRYNRIAFIYDLMEAPLEFLRLASWREKLRSRIIITKIFEIKLGIKSEMEIRTWLLSITNRNRTN
jgi:hypothetical protein